MAGLAVAVFDTAIEYQSGRVNIQSTCLNILKGFMAVSLFTKLPVALYKFCITLQTTFSDDLMSSFTGSVRGDLGDTANVVLKSMAGYSGLIGILTVIALAYCVITVLCEYQKRRNFTLSDSGGKPVYVFDSERFFRWIQQLVQTDIRAVSDSFFTDNTAVSGTAYMADKYAFGTWNNAFGK